MFQLLRLRLETSTIPLQAAKGVPADMLVDGTFRVTPVQFYQLLIVFLVVNGGTLPAFMVLMTKRNLPLYNAVFARVARLLGVVPAHILSE